MFYFKACMGLPYLFFYFFADLPRLAGYGKPNVFGVHAS